MELNALTRWDSYGARLNELIAYRRSLLQKSYGLYNSRSSLRNEERASDSEKIPVIPECIEQEKPAEPTEPSRSHRNVLLELLIRGFRRFLKGFAMGYIGKFLFAFLPFAVRVKFDPSKLSKNLFTLALRSDVLQYGAFVGSILCSFESVMRFMKDYRLLLLHIRPILAGLVSGLSLLFLPRDARVGLCMFFFVRALEVLAKYGVMLKLLPSFNHADTLLMAVASAQVIWSWILNPQDLDINYLRFLDIHGGKTRAQCNALKEGHGLGYIPFDVHLAINSIRIRSNQPPIPRVIIPDIATGTSSCSHFFGQTAGACLSVCSNPAQPVSLPIPYYDMKSTPCGYVAGTNGASEVPAEFGNSFNNICSYLCHSTHPAHPNCVVAFALFFKEAMFRSLPVYIPVYLIPLVVFKMKAMYQRPLSVLIPTVLNITRSSVFLSLYCSMCWLIPCTLRNLNFYHSLVAACAGFSGGSMVIFEKKNRRIELGLYVLSHALVAAYNFWHRHRVLPYIPNFEVFLTGVSMSVLMYAYVHEPTLLRPSYHSLLTFVFGSGAKQCGFYSKKVNVAHDDEDESSSKNKLSTDMNEKNVAPCEKGEEEYKSRN